MSQSFNQNFHRHHLVHHINHSQFSASLFNLQPHYSQSRPAHNCRQEVEHNCSVAAFRPGARFLVSPALGKATQPVVKQSSWNIISDINEGNEIKGACASGQIKEGVVCKVNDTCRHSKVFQNIVRIALNLEERKLAWVRPDFSYSYTFLTTLPQNFFLVLQCH